MDEPFDELMGPSPAQRKQMQTATISISTPAVVSPDPSPVARSSSGPPSNAFSGRSTGPPSSAFGSGRSTGPPSNAFSRNTSDRWAQYEKDEATLRNESNAATGQAVLSAAVRAADRASAEYDVDDRMSNAGASLPHAEELRASKSGSSSGFSFASNRKTRRTNEEEIVYDTHDRVRAEALQLLEIADDMSGVKKTNSGGFTTDPVSPARRRVPSKLSGLDFTSGRSSASTRASQSSAHDQRYTMDDVDVEEEEDDMVEVVAMQNTVGRQSSSMTDDSNSKSSWSSRYSVNQSLMALTTGYSDTKDILDTMDTTEQRRMDKSARNMFRTSPHQAQKSPKVFGNGFSFTAKNYFSRKEPANEKNVNLKTVWMDVDLQSNGRSLPSPPYASKQRGPVSLEQARKRRRIFICAIGALVMIIIVAAVLGSKAGDFGKSGSASALVDPNAVKFYVTGDIPYDANQENKLIRDIDTVPVDADFMLHLGNIQDASVTLCPQQAYIGARAILRASPVPVFVLPGPNDWNNCPDPDVAFADWKENLGYFERNFVHHFGVTHQLGNEENFGFLEKGVFFIGLHLVSGRKHDKEAWRVRHAKNVRWVEEQLANVPKDKYRALIFLANARPSQQHEDFFSEIFDDVNALGKPVLYVHANAGSGNFEQYKPFQEASNLLAVQVPSGGSNPPLKVAVGEGKNPFVFSTA